MGSYINIGNDGFKSALKGDYVDKTGLIAVINGTLFGEDRFTCVSRCRRFGKSMAAKMLCAYYDRSCDSRELFRGLEIEKHPDFEEYLNRYPVIFVDMTDFMTKYRKDMAIVDHIKDDLLADLHSHYPDILLNERDDVMDLLVKVTERYGDKFIIIVDEWDAICREFAVGTGVMDEYVDFLRRLFKGEKSMRVFAGAYLTGILPVKKYKTESALNNFREYSMVRPKGLAGYLGFTKSEVEALCEKYAMDYEDVAKWYDGYSLGKEPSIFNPNSVMEAFASHECDSYWSATGAFDAVARYISMDFEGLKGDIINMLAGGSCLVDTTGFKNDPTIIKTKDDVFTLLIHLGYLAYNSKEKRCYVPNMEVAGEMKNAIVDNGWTLVTNAIGDSERLLDHLLAGEADAVAAGIGKVHEESASVLKHNDENSLSCVINLAFYAARSKYKMLRELPSGKGFADVVFLPWRNVDFPAIVVELKWKKDAVTAIDQIHDRNYPASLKEYVGEVILCGINYDKDSKTYSCVIERI